MRVAERKRRAFTYWRRVGLVCVCVCVRVCAACHRCQRLAANALLCIGRQQPHCVLEDWCLRPKFKSCLDLPLSFIGVRIEPMAFSSNKEPRRKNTADSRALFDYPLEIKTCPEFFLTAATPVFWPTVERRALSALFLSDIVRLCGRRVLMSAIR